MKDRCSLSFVNITECRAAGKRRLRGDGKKEADKKEAEKIAQRRKDRRRAKRNHFGGDGAVWRRSSMSFRMVPTDDSTTAWPFSRVASVGSPHAPVGEYVPLPCGSRVSPP